MNAQTIEKIKELQVRPQVAEISPLSLIQQLQRRMQELEDVSARKVFVLNELSTVLNRKTKVV